MARSTKTKHVMDLVGAEPVKKTAHPPKPVTAERVEKAPADVLKPAEVKEAAPHIKLRAEAAASVAEAVLQVETDVQEEELRQMDTAPEEPVSVSVPTPMSVPETVSVPVYTPEPMSTPVSVPETISAPVYVPEPMHSKPKITAVVCELINQELLNVSERFNLRLTDSNLWELTKAALEEVRPEFAVSSEELNEKLERLRPKVIAAMAKAAIKLSAFGRK